MSEREPERPVPTGVAEAVIERRSRPSVIWVIPVVAALAGGFVAWRAIAERGPEITIHFATAEGLEAGKTKVRYKDVEVGLVEEIELARDLSGVAVRARMAKEFTPHLTDQTRFWVMKAHVAGGQVSGLGTLFSGAYIGVDPAPGGPAREFRGLESAPVVTTDQPGRHFVLRSYRAGAFASGTPVFYRKIRVGEVMSSELDPSGEFVTVRIFVDAPHDARVHEETRFWNASGFDLSMSAEGVRVDTESLASILIGGIAFDTHAGITGRPAAKDTVFPLYESREASEQRTYTRKVTWLLHFDHSVRGLVPGSPVEFRGIRVGEVTDVRLEIEGQQRIRIPVLVEIEPGRFGGDHPEGPARRAAMERLVAGGLRAQLKSGNLLTGQLLVALDMHPDAPPAQIAWREPYPEMPTIPTPMEEITADLGEIVQKIDRMPLEEIGAELRDSLAALSDLSRQVNEDVVPQLSQVLVSAERTLASANAMVGADSPVNQELRRALVEMTETARSLGLAAQQIEREPESLIRGRE